MQKGFAVGWILVVVVILITIAGGVYYLNNKPTLDSEVTSFEGCKQAVGSKLLTSYPAVCVTQGGQRFVEKVDQDKLKPPVTATPSAVSSNSKTFTSARLGISFQYSPKSADEPLIVKEDGNKITVGFANNGSSQAVEVFTKDSKDSLTEAVKKRFITGKYSEQDCLVKESTNGVASQSLPQSYVMVEIRVPQSADDTMETLSVKWQKCPAAYTTTNGISYFLMDKDHPDKFVFFSIGQYSISSGTEKISWQNTIKFL